MKKTKKYAEGGITINQQPKTFPTEVPGMTGYSSSNSGYPFQSDVSSSSATGTDSGVNQTFNMQPQATAGQPEGMKRGGKVSSASKRADGCAIRGKTRA